MKVKRRTADCMGIRSVMNEVDADMKTRDIW